MYNRKIVRRRKIKNVLVVGCDLLSTRFSKLPVETLDLKSLFNYMFFGDGAGAVIVSKSKDKSIRYSEMFSDHAYVGMGSCFYVGGSTNPYISEAVDKDKWGAYQASGLSEKYLSEVLIDTLRGIQDKIEVSLSKIDAFSIARRVLFTVTVFAAVSMESVIV